MQLRHQAATLMNAGLDIRFISVLKTQNSNSHLPRLWKLVYINQRRYLRYVFLFEVQIDINW